MLAFQLGVTLALLLTVLLVWRNHRDFRCPALRPVQTTGDSLPLVSVLVPVRNEAGNIEACLAGLLSQDYPRLEIVVLDDGSTDDTAERARKLAITPPHLLRVVTGSGLPTGWAGKAHACWEAAHAAGGEWLLFVDADTRHAPELVSRAMGEARASGADLLSTFPRQVIGGVGEALTVPVIYWVLFTLLPIGQVERHPGPQFAAACGQFLLARRDAYFEVGGHRSIHGTLHDGLHLARLFKARGLRYVLVDLSTSISCRMYHGWRECCIGFTRNAYQAIGSVPVLVFLTVIQSALCLSPVAALLFGLLGQGPTWQSPLAVLQLGLIASIQISLRRRFAYPWLTVVLFPVAIVVFLAIQWQSWWNLTHGRSVPWKGRVLGSLG